jgi:hypothetical protein
MIANNIVEICSTYKELVMDCMAAKYTSSIRYLLLGTVLRNDSKCCEMWEHKEAEFASENHKFEFCWLAKKETQKCVIGTAGESSSPHDVLLAGTARSEQGEPPSSDFMLCCRKSSGEQGFQVGFRTLLTDSLVCEPVSETVFTRDGLTRLSPCVDRVVVLSNASPFETIQIQIRKHDHGGRDLSHRGDESSSPGDDSPQDDLMRREKSRDHGERSNASLAH